MGAELDGVIANLGLVHHWVPKLGRVRVLLMLTIYKPSVILCNGGNFSANINRTATTQLLFNLWWQPSSSAARATHWSVRYGCQRHVLGRGKCTWHRPPQPKMSADAERLSWSLNEERLIEAIAIIVTYSCVTFQLKQLNLLSVSST